MFNAHNLPSGGEPFVPWRARLNDDLINAVNVWRTGRIELSVKCLAMNMPPTQSEGGGLTDIHHAADWKRIVPKIISDEYCK